MGQPRPAGGPPEVEASVILTAPFFRNLLQSCNNFDIFSVYLSTVQ